MKIELSMNKLTTHNFQSPRYWQWLWNSFASYFTEIFLTVGDFVVCFLDNTVIKVGAFDGKD